MRAYFKNDLYTLAAHREREKQVQAQQKEQDKLAQKKKTNDEVRGKTTSPAKVDDCLTIKLDKKENEGKRENADFSEMMKSLKKRAAKEEQQGESVDSEKEKSQSRSESKRKKSEARNIFAGGFKPKSTLVIKEELKPVKTDDEERKERKQHNIEFKKMENEIKRIAGHETQKDEGEEKAEGKQEKAKGASDASSSEEEVVKTKKIKKQANYQRLDLKKRYQDRYLGAKHNNLRRFNRNGTLKPKYRMQKEVGIEDGEIYNSYIASLSKSLKVTVNLDEDDSSNEEDSEGPMWVPPEDPSSKEELTKSLQGYFGFQAFREGQFETIQHILGGRSTMFISQTASGKSLTYIMSSMILKGFSMVISPLVSLMLDQLEHLPLELTGACISSLISKENQRSIAEQVKKGNINILFLTPQALQTDFLYHLQDFPEANFVCVDQAHSLSELSHNFRTSFLMLSDVILHMVKYRTRRPTVLGLTATANPQTVASVVEKLEIAEVVRSSSCMNKNLFVTVSRQRGQLKYQSLIRYLNDPLICECKGILVYTRTRKIMDEVFNYISNSVSVPVAMYHSALPSKQKTDTLEKFRRGQVRIVVATVALGMGLDFQQLQCVIHLNMPKSIENYVQEIGRAGRRQRRAYCHLFLDENDYITERNYIIADQIEPPLLAMIYQQLRDHSVIRQPTRKRPLSKQMQQMEEELVIKRAAILVEHMNRNQVIYEDEDEHLDSEELEAAQQQEKEAPKVNSQLFCIRINKLVELTQLKEEAILTLIMKVQQLLRDDKEVRFRVLPTSHELLKLGFFKQNQSQLRKASHFFCKLVDGCKRIKGHIYIPLIDKCNELQLRPVQLLTQLFRLKDQYWLRVEEDNPVFVWQFQGRRLDLEEGMEHELGQLVDRGFDRLMGGEFITHVVEQMREVQSTSLVKLNTLWSLAFLHSRNHITNVLQGRLLPRSQPIPPNGLPSDLDDYFRSSLTRFYSKITNDGSEIYIPTSTVDPKDIPQIYGCLCLFFKHEMSNQGEPQNPLETRQARERVIEKYEDGKVITKILMGVNSGEVTWKIYGERSYWMEFKLKNYSQLLEVVREQIQKYKEEHRVAETA